MNAPAGHAAPLAILLVGVTGSGKTTLTEALAERGMVRFSVDEEVHRRHGRYGIDYPEHEYFERQRSVVAAVGAALVEQLKAGHDVVLDYGLWSRDDREAWKKTVEQAGGRWRLVYLPASRETLLRRLVERNLREDANALAVTELMLDDFLARFTPPTPEENAIVYTGHVDDVYTTDL